MEITRTPHVQQPMNLCADEEGMRARAKQSRAYLLQQHAKRIELQRRRSLRYELEAQRFGPVKLTATAMRNSHDASMLVSTLS